MIPMMSCGVHLLFGYVKRCVWQNWLKASIYADTFSWTVWEKIKELKMESKKYFVQVWVGSCIFFLFFYLFVVYCFWVYYSFSIFSILHHITYLPLLFSWASVIANWIWHHWLKVRLERQWCTVYRGFPELSSQRVIHLEKRVCTLKQKELTYM